MDWQVVECEACLSITSFPSTKLLKYGEQLMQVLCTQLVPQKLGNFQPILKIRLLKQPLCLKLLVGPKIVRFNQLTSSQLGKNAHAAENLATIGRHAKILFLYVARFQIQQIGQGSNNKNRRWYFYFKLFYFLFQCVDLCNGFERVFSDNLGTAKL